MTTAAAPTAATFPLRHWEPHFPSASGLSSCSEMGQSHVLLGQFQASLGAGD
jgi:hypothetical protein